MADVTMEQLLQKSTQIQKLMVVAANESDPDKMKVLTDQLAAEGRALEKELGAEYAGSRSCSRRGRCKGDHPRSC